MKHLLIAFAALMFGLGVHAQHGYQHKAQYYAPSQKMIAAHIRRICGL